jgi:PAS domain S-box-containing protein
MGKESILIVEDERIVAMDLKQILGDLGYHVAGVASYGEEAVERVKTSPPQLVLMDILLKGDMSGVEAARIIQSEYRVPVVYLTAHADSRTIREATSIGPYGYIVKPVELIELKTTLEVALFKFRTESQLKESEERFKEIFLQNFDAIILFRTEDFSVLDANPAALRFFDYSREDLFAGFDLVFENEKLYRLFKDEIIGFPRGEMDVFLDRCRLKKRDGADIICSIKANVIQLHEDEVLYCTFRDITESVRLEEESRLLQAKLIQANKMTSLGTLASGIAHEINNPNNFIMSNTQIIEQVWRDAVKRLADRRLEAGNFSLGGLGFDEVKELMPQLMQATLEGCRRIKLITDNLKEFSRPDDVGAYHRVSINQVLEFSFSMLDNEIKKCTDRFSFIPGERIPEFNGNSQQIEQVVMNLIQNALQALPDRNCQVRVSTELDRPANMIVVKVRDEGVGMNPKMLDRITDPFFTTRQDRGGTGLGLYVSYSIIKKHHGALEFESQSGSGTTATVKLPLNNMSIFTPEEPENT